MKSTGRIALLAAIASCFLAYTGFAQSSQDGQNQQSQNQQSQNQANASQNQDQDQYTGVSHPPPDDTIQANEDLAVPAPAPAPAPKPKPSPAVAAAPPPAGNADGGVVTGSFDGANAPVSLATRGENPDYGIVNYVPDNPHQLAEGTNLRVELSEDLSSEDTPRGAMFEAKVVRNVYKDGRVIIPIGSVMRGRVTEVSQGHRLGLHASMRLTPEEVDLPDGTEYHLLAEAVESTATGTKVNQEGVVEATVRYKKDAVEYGAGAGVGAAAGGVIGGPVGAGVGALAGTGVVATHMLMTHPEAANLPQGSVLIFSLTQPMELTAKN